MLFLLYIRDTAWPLPVVCLLAYGQLGRVKRLLSNAVAYIASEFVHGC